MVMNFDHTGIVVQDLEKITDFYVNVLGLVVEREIDSVAGPDGIGLSRESRAVLTFDEPLFRFA